MTVQTVEAQLEALNEKIDALLVKSDALLGEFESDPAENKWPRWMSHLIRSITGPIKDVVDGVKDDVGLVKGAIKKIDVTKPVEKVVKDVKTLVTKPRLPGLDYVLDDPKHFTDMVASNLDSSALYAMLRGAQNANKIQPSQHAVTSVLEAIDGLLGELDRIARAALDGQSLPAIRIARKICEELRWDVDALEDAWVLMKFPSPVNLDEFTTAIRAHTDDLAKVSPAANAPYRDWKIASSVVIGFLEIVAETFSWLAASFPIGQNVGIGGGISVGVQVAGKVDISVVSWNSLVSGGIAALCKDVISILTTIDGAWAATEQQAA